MRKIVYFEDYNNGAISPIDNINVDDNYGVDDYIKDLKDNGNEWVNELSHGQFIIEKVDED